MIGLPYELILHEKVLITDPELNDTNTMGGMKYIPGSVIRGALIAEAKKNSIDILVGNNYEVFLSGKVKFLNAYPGSQDHVRTLPTPLSYHLPKDDDAKVYDLIHLEQLAPDIKDKQFDRVSSVFHEIPDYFYGYEPEFEIRLHNQLAHSTGSSNRNMGQVFTYNSLVPGQIFRGAILAESQEFLGVIKGLAIEGTLLVDIGRSRGVEYGRAEFRFEEADTDWQETRGSYGVNENRIVVTCLSDVILREPDTGSFSCDLDSLFGCEHDMAYSRIKTIGGFNRTWGMRLPQCQAISAGSVFVYDIAEELNFESFVEYGVGERTVDGFGRIAIDYQNEVEFDSFKGDVESVRFITSGERNPEDDQFIKYLLKNICLQRIEKQMNGIVLTVVQNLKHSGQIGSMPPNTQLSRLYRVIMSTRNEIIRRGSGNLRPIETFLNLLTKDTRAKYETAKVGNDNLVHWVMGYCQDPNKIWHNLAIEEPTIGELNFNKETLSAQMVCEYLGGVIKAILKERKGVKHD